MQSTDNTAVANDQDVLFEFTPENLKIEGNFERVALDSVEIAPNNPRRQFSAEGIDRLAMALMCKGQLSPVIGHRPDGSEKVMIYDGQRRVLAARRSHELSAELGDSQLKAISHVLVHVLDKEPTEAELRVIRAQANWSEQLSSADQQEQFQLCWDERVGMSEDERMRYVCLDLGISLRKGGELRKQLRLPEEIRTRIAVGAPRDGQITSTLATQLVPMFETSPQLAEAVADQVTSTERLRSALDDLSAFVHMTLLEREDVFAERLEHDAALRAQNVLARVHNAIEQQGLHSQAAQALGVTEEQFGGKMDELSDKAETNGTIFTVTPQVRERVMNYGAGYRIDRGEKFAASVWCCDPVLMLDMLADVIDQGPQHAGNQGGFFSAADIHDAELEAAKVEGKSRQEIEQLARTRNKELGQAVASSLTDPPARLLHAVQRGMVEMIAGQYADLIAYGAGWTDANYQQAVGGTTRMEPKDQKVIVEQIVEKACEDADPLNGLARLFAEIAKGFVLDLDGVTRTKALGSERMEKRLSTVRSQCPGLAEAVWEMVAGSLREEEKSLWRDQLVPGEDHSTVDLESAAEDITLDELEDVEGEL